MIEREQEGRAAGAPDRVQEHDALAAAEPLAGPLLRTGV